MTQKGFPVARHRSKFKSDVLGQNKKTRKKGSNTSTRFREAMEMLKSMTPDEIKEAREEVNSLLTSESIAFLKRKCRQKMDMRRQYDSRDITLKENTTIEKEDLSKLVTDQDLFDAAKKSKGIERERLAWIVGKEHKDEEEEEEEEGTLRIDLNGNVVSAEDDPDRLRGLHHHGKHPDKAGYTVRELTILSASAFPAQKATALKALASYYERDSTSNNNNTQFDVKLIPTICMVLRSDRKNRTVWSTGLALTRALGTSLMRATKTRCEDDCFENIYLTSSEKSRKDVTDILGAVEKFGFMRICIQNLKTKEERNSVCPLMLSCSRQSLSLASSCYECVRTMFMDVLRCPQNHTPEHTSCVFELIRTVCEAGKNLAERVCSDGVLDMMLRTVAVRVMKDDDILKTESLRM